MNNLHISLTEFRNESRVLKETNSILNHNIASKVYIASLHSDRLEEEKIYNDNLILNRFKLSSKLFGSIFISLFIVFVLLVGLINFFDIDLDQFRIFDFGSGDVSSVSSRLALWDNFLIHFDYNPIFGNMAVDALTTGEGTYVHSFIATLLTHLGIVGFIFFFIYLFVAIKEKLKSSNNLYVNNLFALYSLIVFAGIFAIASFGTFITWIPLWFLLGLIFPPIVFKNRKELNFEKSNINSIK